MPIYAIRCGSCGKTDEVFRSVKDYDNLPECCGQKMGRQVCAPMVAPDIQPYRSTVTGELIGSRSAHREHLKRHNLVEVGNDKPRQGKLPDVAGRREAIVESLKRHRVRGFA
jgi:hypothetical protein